MFCNGILPHGFSILQEKKAQKEEKLKLEEKYMWAWVDGNKEKVIAAASFFLDTFAT